MQNPDATKGESAGRDTTLGASRAENTRRAYATDWSLFARWCRGAGLNPLPPRAETVALYLTRLARGNDRAPALSAPSIERRLSGLVWNYAERGMPLDRGDPRIVAAMAEVRRGSSRAPAQKVAVTADDILAMVSTLPFDLRGLRDRALLLVGYAGGMRRSEIVNLDRRRDDRTTGTGWVELYPEGIVARLPATRGLREVEIGRGTAERSCPVAALERWLDLARIDTGPLFQPVSRDGTRAQGTRLNDRHVARLIKRTVRDAGLRPDLPEAERLALFSGHSLRAGFVRSTNAPGSERFRVNLTRAAGL